MPPSVKLQAVKEELKTEMDMDPLSKNLSVGVIGGGIMGMYLAHRLAQNGNQVSLFEAENTFGGLVGAWEICDTVWDRYYHVILSTDTRTVALLNELGLGHEIRWAECPTGFYANGKMHSLSGALEFLRFPPLNLWSKFRLGLNILHASRTNNWQKLEQTTAEDWLTRWSGKATFEKIWKPLLRAKLGDHYKDVSAAFIWATICRMYGARSTGSKKEEFGYVPGGYSRIIDRFSRKLTDEGVSLKADHKAVQIEHTSAGNLVTTFENGLKETFDRIVLTIPSTVASKICPSLPAEEKDRLEKIKYIGIVCASLLLKKPLTDYYITNITDRAPSFTAVIEISALVDRQQFGGRALVYLPKYITSDDPFYSLSDDEIKEKFLSDLEHMHPGFQREDLDCFQIARTSHVFSLPVLNYSKQLFPVRLSLSGLFICNSALIVSGILNVNETILRAETALAGELSPLIKDQGVRGP